MLDQKAFFITINQVVMLSLCTYGMTVIKLLPFVSEPIVLIFNKICRLAGFSLYLLFGLDLFPEGVGWA